jgi:hypothetical protein
MLYSQAGGVTEKQFYGVPRRRDNVLLKTDDISSVYVFLIKSKSAGTTVKTDNLLLFH